MKLKINVKSNRGLKKLLYILIFLTLTPKVFSQFFVTGEDPSFLKWDQINTEHFTIIFPLSFQHEANHLANVMDYIYKNVAKSYNHQPHKITVVLHTYSSNSNGLVTWAPRRMELYTTPPQNTYSQEWLDQLAVHEMRHVVQLDNLNQGAAYILSFIFGEQVVGTLSGLLPPWLFEGDAVNNETALTSTGRGRDATFEMEMKALVTTNKNIYSYDKSAFGSYKDNIPNRYALGYPLVAWSRENFHSTPNDSTMNFFGGFPTSMLSFPSGIKKFTKQNQAGLYNLAFNDLKKRWLKQLNTVKPDSFKYQWNKRNNNDFVSYRLPQIVNDTTVLVLKTSIDLNPQFILLYKNGGETKITRPGNFAIDKLSYSNQNFVWSEEIPDIRWGNRSYYCIKKCNIKTKKTIILSKHSRYFGPVLSPDGNQIATIEISTENKYSVVILNAENGKIINTIPSENNLLIQLPTWDKSGQNLYALSNSKKGKCIVKINLESHTFENITDPTFQVLGQPSDSRNYIFFEAQYNGTPNIYALNKIDNSLWQVTNEKFGAFTPTLINANKILYSSYSEKGYNINTSSFNIDSLIPINKVNDTSIKLYERSAKLEHFNFQDSTIISKNYKVTTYSKNLHLFNFHSWAPFYINYDNLDILSNNISPGVSFISQNILGTMISTFGYKYENGISFEQANFSYKGLYPAINLTVDYGGSIPSIRANGIAAPAQTNDLFKTTTQIYLPLNLTKGPVISSLTPGVEIKYQDFWIYNSSTNKFHNGFTQIAYYFTYYNFLTSSLRDIQPPWGFIVSGKIFTTPFNNRFGTLSFIQSSIYTPGIFKHNSLKISTAYQHQNDFYYNSQIAFPRGLVDEDTQTLITGSLDYEFPICYPDISLGSILYIKRLRANVFQDVALNKYIITNNKYSRNLSSTGLDITADFHFLRLIFPMNAGIRTIYIPGNKNINYEIIFRLNLNSL